jgi:two-component system, OmpR family, phosphate regulon sensor histidine kinase PhoR
MNMLPILTKAFDFLEEGIIIIDVEGKVYFFNDLIRKIFQIEESTLLTKKLHANHKLWLAIQQAYELKKMSDIQWTDNEMSYRSRIFFINDGDFQGLVVRTQDITKLEQFQKIQSDFLADISHELKTPLAAILGASEILGHNDRNLTRGERNTFQEVIVKESQRLNRMINELSDLSEMNIDGFKRLVMTKVNLKVLMDEVGNTFQLMMNQKGIYFSNKVDETIDVIVDRDKFFQIFVNLLSNAIRYTHTGGVTVSTGTSSRFVHIEFADTGLGIPPYQLERIFDRFYRTDQGRSRGEGGSGLGLAITRAIVEAHKGTITAESAVGHGTKFYITIPKL